MNLWPIYVPSKGRAGTSQLLARFGELLVDAITVVVEPQEFLAYRAAYPKLCLEQLIGNNGGITFARRSVTALARKRGHRWFWMMDDDITGFYRTVGNKCVRHPAFEVLCEAQQISLPNVAQIALEYQQFSWSAKQPIAVNSYCDVCVAIRTEATVKHDYRPVDLKEDRDFTMQLIQGGWTTVRCRQLAFSCPKNGSNKGGLFEEYAQPGREVAAVEKLCGLWPWCCTRQVKPNGRIDAKIDWKRIRQA